MTATGSDERPLPVLAAMLAVMNRLPGETDRTAPVAQRRAAQERSPLSMPVVTRRGREALLVEDFVVSDTASVRRYRPQGQWFGLPTHVLIHGGSYWAGSVDAYDPICRWYAYTARCQVYSVDYRLAPEHPYPAAVEDCYAALAFVARAVGVDPHRLSVGGISAGGGLAAVMALMARDRGGPALCLQVLEIPGLDPSMSGASLHTYGEGYGLGLADIVEGWDFYLPDHARRSEPYASPATAPDLTGLPPAFVLTGGCDPLRDEGETYADRLRAAGVPVEQYRAHGHVHGSTYLTRLLPSARTAVAHTVAALRRAYGT